MRSSLAIAVTPNWHFHQLSISNMFLNGDHLHEELYMQLPPGFKQLEIKNLVCQLQKSLYGLKHVSHQWFAKLQLL